MDGRKASEREEAGTLIPGGAEKIDAELFSGDVVRAAHRDALSGYASRQRPTANLAASLCSKAVAQGPARDGVYWRVGIQHNCMYLLGCRMHSACACLEYTVHVLRTSCSISMGMSSLQAATRQFSTKCEVF